MVFLGILNVATFLRYGKDVQKRRGIWKYLIFILAGFLITTIIIGRGMMGSLTSKFTIHVMTLGFVFALLGYYIYGFYNYMKMRRNPQPSVTSEDT